jgi:hypothetical protein
MHMLRKRYRTFADVLQKTEKVIFLQISIDLGLKSHQVLKIEGAMNIP